MALGAEFVAQLRELSSLGDDLTVCVGDTAPRLAEHIAPEIARMVESVRGNGRIR